MTTTDRLPDQLAAADGPAHPVAHYAADVASASPAPGGGSVAGVVGALAAALAEMVGHLSAGRMPADTDTPFQPDIDAAARQRARLLELASADEAAYSDYVNATKLPKATDEEKATRRDAMQAALAGAAEVPLAIAAACQEILTLLDPLAQYGNKHVISDVVVAAMCAEVAARAALLNVHVNARMIKDEARAHAYRDAATASERIIRDQASAVIGTAAQRM